MRRTTAPFAPGCREWAERWAATAEHAPPPAPGSGIALQNADYRFASTIGSFVVIPAGSVQLNIPITPIDDWIVEGSETLRVELDDETSAGTPVPYTIGGDDRVDLVLTDNESAAIPPPAIVTVSISDSGGWETPQGTDPAVFVVSRTNDLTSAIDVAFTLGGTATGGADYTVPPLTVTIPAGATSANVVIPVLDDPHVEPAAAVTLTVTPHPNTVMPPPPGFHSDPNAIPVRNFQYDLGTVRTATATIRDNDVVPAPFSIVTLTAADTDAQETAPSETPNPGAFRITRDGPTAAPLTVNLAITTPPRPTHITSQVAPAANGVDYDTIPTSVTIPAAADRATIIVNPIDDLFDDDFESIALTPQTPPLDVEPPAYALAATSATQATAGATIRDYYIAPLTRFERARYLRFGRLPARFAAVARPRDPLAPPPPPNLVGYTVEASTNLVNWEPIGTVDPSEDEEEFVDLNAGDFEKRFYRFVPILTPPAPRFAPWRRAMGVRTGSGIPD